MFIIFGILTGILGFLPLYLSLMLSKKVTSTSNFGYGTYLILGVLTSLFILFLCVFLYFSFIKIDMIYYTITTAIVLSVVAISFGVYTSVRRDATAKKRIEDNNKKKENA